VVFGWWVGGGCKINEPRGASHFLYAAISIFVVAASVPLYVAAFYFLYASESGENEKISGKNKMAALFSLFMRTKKRPRVRWRKKNAKNKMQPTKERKNTERKSGEGDRG